MSNPQDPTWRAQNDPAVRSQAETDPALVEKQVRMNPGPQDMEGQSPASPNSPDSPASPVSPEYDERAPHAGDLGAAPDGLDAERRYADAVRDNPVPGQDTPPRKDV